jgi:uncharacterized repeat protein (TIGR04076 family)
MPSQVAGCKITVLKRTLNEDLMNAFLEDAYQDRGPCEVFEDGQELFFEGYSLLEKVPEGFCPSAWADIRQDVFTLLVGGDIPGMKEPGVTISGCHDWFRPVLFRIQRIDQG